jgi:cytochrome c oxidase subunit IV
METEVSAAKREGIGGWLIVWLILFLMVTLGTFLGSYEHSGIMRILLGLTLCLNTVVLVLFFLRKSLFRHRGQA